MRAVNLLPPDRGNVNSGSRRRAKLILPAFGVVTIAAVAGLSLAVWSANSTVNTRQRQLEAIQAQLAKLPAVPQAATTTVAPPRGAALVELAGARLPWDGFLGAFARVVPENVWLSTLQANAPGAAATVAASQAAEAAALAASSASAADTSSGSASTTPAPPPVSSTPSVFSITGYTYSQPSVARLMRRLVLIPWLSDIALVSSSKTTIGNDTVYEFTVGATVVPTAQGAA